MQTYNAILWKKAADNQVICNLCPHNCHLMPGQYGFCNARHNSNGEMINHCYYDICSAAIDPVEKKPLFHFLPGTRVMSIATPGCNLKCCFCQNAAISMPRTGSLPLSQDVTLTPAQIVESALVNRCSAIAYTYTEPTVYLELAADCAALARQYKLKNIMVSNGYMSPESAAYAGQFIDAANIDLKGFTDSFYKNYCKGSLSPVLKTLEFFARQEHIWLEITTLLIPGLNDSDNELTQLVSYIANDLGRHIPWHISRFHPAYKCVKTPPTSIESLKRAYQIGKQAGLDNVFVGNLPGAGLENSYCPACKEVIIERTGYHISRYNILAGKCMGCGKPIDGVFANFGMT